MPNPILRAGPFASSTNSFLDRPDPVSTSIFPVNCAKDNQAFWPWRAYLQTNRTNISSAENIVRSYTTDTFIEVVGEPFEASISFFFCDASAVFNFYYQAAQDWQFSSGSELNIQYAGGDFYEYRYRIIGGTVEVDEQEDGLTSPDSQEFDISTITFPATVVPRRVSILASVQTTFEGSSPAGMVGTVDINLNL